MTETPQETQIERTPTGEIKDQGTTALTTEKAPTDPTTETKSTTPPSEDKSLLNKDAPGKPEGAPETYTDFKVPDGYELDSEVAKEASGIFKGLGLSQDQAQTLVDFYTAKTTEAASQPYDLYKQTRETWRTEIKADPEFGPKIEQIKATVSKALDGLGDAKLTSEFKAAMDLTGAGDNPAFIKTFYKLAQQLTEGGHVTGTAPSKFGQKEPGSGPQSAAKALYPNLP